MTLSSSNSWGNNWMSFLQLVLSLDKTKDGFNSILPIVSFWPISQQWWFSGMENMTTHRQLLQIQCHIMTEISCGENTMAVFICHQFSSILSAKSVQMLSSKTCWKLFPKCCLLILCFRKCSYVGIKIKLQEFLRWFEAVGNKARNSADRITFLKNSAKLIAI